MDGNARRHETPTSIRQDHAELRRTLALAAAAGGRVGSAAAEVARIYEPHTEREDRLVLPPLGLLPRIAHGEVDAAMSGILPVADALRRELPELLEEHRALRCALERLARAALAEDRPDVVRLAEALVLHEQEEEQVTFPAALLVGEYLRLRLPDAAGPR